MRPVAILAAFILGGLGLNGRSTGQEVDRSKVEVQAAGQAAEADRLFKRGEWAQALALYDAERASRAALGDLRYEAYALRAMGLCQAELGDDETAIETLHQARVLDLKREDKGYAGYDLFLVAQAEIRLDRPLDGLKSLSEAFPLLSQAVDRDHETDAQLVMTRTLITVGRAEEARPHVHRAITLAQELNDEGRLADAWASSGQVEGSLGNASLALERFDDARELFEGQGRAAESAWMETVSGSTLLFLGRNDLALARFEEAARLHEHLEDGGSVAEDLSAVAGLLLEAGRVDQALDAARKAVEKARTADDRPREVDARVRLAQVLGSKGDWVAASDTLDDAVDLIRLVARDEPSEQVRMLLTAAAIDRKAGRVAKAEVRFETAARIAADSGLEPLRRVVAEARVPARPISDRRP